MNGISGRKRGEKTAVAATAPTQAALAAKKASATIPIVFTDIASDPAPIEIALVLILILLIAILYKLKSRN